MNLVPVSVDSIHIGKPLPFPVMDKDGVLIAKRGYVVASRKDLLDFSQRNGGLFIDIADSEAHHKAYVEKLQSMVREDRALGEIASTKLERSRSVEREDAQPPLRLDWLDLQFQAHALSMENHPLYFADRLERLAGVLLQQSRDNPDGTLFALMYLSASDTQMYSATHGMLVSVVCLLAARDVLRWPGAEQELLFRAALTMNIGMAQVQDQLANQKEPPTLAQRRIIDEHSHKSAQVLERLGIDSHEWLEVVRNHHQQVPGPLGPRTLSERITRLIQRADMFAAKLAPRASRAPVAPAQAMQSCYYDENRQVDEAGVALIKALGVYPPGTFVRLATEEIAVVVKRGSNTSMPRVAVLVNRSGMPTIEPIQRDTSLREHRVVAGVPFRDVKVRLNLEKLLPLTLPTGAERAW
ncbi:MAG: HD-GYP domain-containing protein [Rhodoferax sp.]